MGWISGVTILDGLYSGEILAPVDTFPNMTDLYNYAVTSINESDWPTSHEEHFFNSELSNMVVCEDLINTTAVTYSNQVIASIGLYDENETRTGYLVLLLSKVDSLTYQVGARLQNASGVNVFDFDSFYSTFIVSSGGVWDNGYKINTYLALAVYTINGRQYLGLYLNLCQLADNPYNGEYGRVWFAGGAYFALDWIYGATGISVKGIGKTKTRSPEFGPASEAQGGYNETGGYPKGTFDFTSHPFPISPKPSLGVTSAGFINVYKIELNELQNLGEKLFPHFLPAEILDDPATLTTPEMLAMIIKMLYGTLISPAGTSIKIADNLGVLDILMNGKLIDYILDCHVIPTSISGATISPLKIGYRTFNDYQLAKATEDYVDIDCGSLNIKEAFGNFLDYNCKVDCFLPFVGFVPIDNEYWNNATLQVHYRFNIIDGSFVARLVATRDNDGKEGNLSNSVIGQYGGVCCVHFPITGMQYSNVVSGLLNGTTGALAKGAGGDIGGAVTNLVNMTSLRPDAPMSNGYNASSSFLGQRKPCLVIHYPAPQFSEMYNKELGLPLNVMRRLNTVHGFTVIDNPILKIACSDSEYNELVSLLKNGVILP